MKNIYVIGHKNPDTDTVCSAISYAYLKRQLGYDAEPRVLGNLNKESKFVLNYFKVPEPLYLNDVKVKIKNMSYLKDASINEHRSLEYTFNELSRLNVTGLPLVDNNNKLKGYINVKEIAKFLIEGDPYKLNTSYSNILEVLDGKEILRFDEEIKGKIKIATFRSRNFTETVKLNHDDILIVADREKILEYAIANNIKLIILVSGKEISNDLIEKARKNNVNIISTPTPAYLTANKIRLCNYVKSINIKKDPITFQVSDTRDDFVATASKVGHTNYPIVDYKNKSVGMLRLIDQNNYDKYNLILVDHNQFAQSVDGIEEANILEVVDHHNLGVLGTTNPISFRTMPVGCTNTIIYEIYKENNVEIPASIAGIMLSAIISDTLLLKSPTTTQKDVETAYKLAIRAGVELEDYGMKMLKAGSSITGLTTEEIVTQDFKEFKVGDLSIGIGQVTTLDFEQINSNINDYIEELDKIKSNKGYKLVLLFVTDILKNGSYLIYSTNSKEILSEAYGIDDINEGYFMPNMVSRKKQMYPPIAEYLNK